MESGGPAQSLHIDSISATQIYDPYFYRLEIVWPCPGVTVTASHLSTAADNPLMVVSGQPHGTSGHTLITVIG